MTLNKAKSAEEEEEEEEKVVAKNRSPGVSRRARALAAHTMIVVEEEEEEDDDDSRRSGERRRRRQQQQPAGIHTPKEKSEERSPTNAKKVSSTTTSLNDDGETPSSVFLGSPPSSGGVETLKSRRRDFVDHHSNNNNNNGERRRTTTTISTTTDEETRRKDDDGSHFDANATAAAMVCYRFDLAFDAFKEYYDHHHHRATTTRDDDERGPLVRVAMTMFEKFVPDLVTRRKRRRCLNREKVETWVRNIEASYRQTIDYHNRAHATDVTQGVGYILERGLSQELDDVEVFALICTAVAHDCGHPGKSNVFLVKTKSEKAKKWNNEAVNENEHVEYAIETFEKCKVFGDDNSNSNSEDEDEEDESDDDGKNTMKETVYEILKTAILYTDMNKHETLIEEFREAVERNRNKKTIKEWTKKEDVHVVLGYVLHCADVMNACRPWPMAKKWAELITEEFYKQGDVEKSLGFEKLTGAHVDRSLRTNITSSRQAVNFAGETVKPLYGMLKEIVPDAVEPLLKQLELNEAKHRALIQQESVGRVASTGIK